MIPIVVVWSASGEEPKVHEDDRAPLVMSQSSLLSNVKLWGHREQNVLTTHTADPLRPGGLPEEWRGCVPNTSLAT